MKLPRLLALLFLTAAAAFGQGTFGTLTVGTTLTMPGGATFTTPDGSSILLTSPAAGSILFAPSTSNVLPNSDNAYAFGSATARWSDLEAVNVILGGDGTNSGRPIMSASGSYPNQGFVFQAHGTGVHSFTGEVEPTTTSTYALGDSLHVWNQLIVNQIGFNAISSGTITGSSGNLTMTTNGTMTMNGATLIASGTNGATISSSGGAISLTGNEVDITSNDGNVLPTVDNNYAFGSATKRWGDIEAVNLVLGGDGTNSGRPIIAANGSYPNQGFVFQAHGTGIHTFTGEVDPTTDATYNMGSATARWDDLEALNIVLGGDGTNSGRPIISSNGTYPNQGIAMSVHGTGSHAFTGPTGITGVLTVTGNTSITGNSAITGGETVSGTMNAGTLHGAALTVTGNSTLTGNLTVTGNATVGSLTAGPVSANSSGQLATGTYPLQATVTMTSNASIGTGSETTLSWNAAAPNDSTIWTSGSPTLLSVPSGAKRIQLVANVRWETSTNGVDLIVKIKDNSSNVWSSTANQSSWAGGQFNGQVAVTPILDTTSNPATSYTMTVEQDSGSSVLVDKNGTTLSMTVFK